MSTLVDDVRAWMRNPVVANFPELLAFLRQLADRVQELEGKGEPVARVVPFDATVKLEWASVEAAHNAKPGPLYTSPPSSVQPEKEERRPLTDEQIDAIAREVFPPDPIIGDAWSEQWDKDVGRPFARAIEAAHGVSPSPSMVGREGEA